MSMVVSVLCWAVILPAKFNFQKPLGNYLDKLYVEIHSNMAIEFIFLIIIKLYTIVSGTEYSFF